MLCTINHVRFNNLCFIIFSPNRVGFSYSSLSTAGKSKGLSQLTGDSKETSTPEEPAEDQNSNSSFVQIFNSSTSTTAATTLLAGATAVGDDASSNASDTGTNTTIASNNSDGPSMVSVSANLTSVPLFNLEPYMEYYVEVMCCSYKGKTKTCIGI